jgi:hypothetical protein
VFGGESGELLVKVAGNGFSLLVWREQIKKPGSEARRLKG